MKQKFGYTINLKGGVLDINEVAYSHYSDTINGVLRLFDVNENELVTYSDVIKYRVHPIDPTQDEIVADLKKKIEEKDEQISDLKNKVESEKNRKLELGSLLYSLQGMGSVKVGFFEKGKFIKRFRDKVFSTKLRYSDHE